VFWRPYDEGSLRGVRGEGTCAKKKSNRARKKTGEGSPSEKGGVGVVDLGSQAARGRLVTWSGGGENTHEKQQMRQSSYGGERAKNSNQMKIDILSLAHYRGAKNVQGKKKKGECNDEAKQYCHNSSGVREVGPKLTDQLPV